MSILVVPGEPVSSRPLPEEDEREDVSSSQVPWMASLGGFRDKKNWDHQCGGSLITSTHILTAAHCVDLMTNGYINGPQMRLGTADMANSTKGVLRNIASLVQHPKYRNPRVYYDVAIALANIPIDFTDFIRPINLPMTPIDDENAFADNLVTLSGWGLEPNQQTYKPRTSFKFVTFQVNNREYCEDDIFGDEALEEAGISKFQLKKRLNNGIFSSFSGHEALSIYAK